MNSSDKDSGSPSVEQATGRVHEEEVDEELLALGRRRRAFARLFSY